MKMLGEDDSKSMPFVYKALNLGETLPPPPLALPQAANFNGFFEFPQLGSKSRNGQVKENDMLVKFVKDEGGQADYLVTATGKNKYGPFRIKGTAKRTQHNDDAFDLHLEKEVSFFFLVSPSFVFVFVFFFVCLSSLR